MYAISLVGGSVSESPQGSRLDDTVGLRVEFLFPSVLSILPLTLPYDSPSSIQCLAVGLFICFHQLLDEASREQLA